ncbi:UDP-galactopyranose mutase, partial [Enterococcus faecalis]
LLFRKYKEKANAQEKVIFDGRLANYQYYDMDQVFGAAL